MTAWYRSFPHIVKPVQTALLSNAPDQFDVTSYPLKHRYSSKVGTIMSSSKRAGSSSPPYFNPKKASSVTLFSEIGQRADRPFMILATFAETSLGDLVSKVAFVNTLKDQFDHARLIVRYNDFRHYSREVISLAPNIDHAEPIRGEAPQWMRRFLHDVRLWRPLSGSITRSKRYHEAFYDLVVVDSMANSRTVHALERTTPLQVPAERRDALADRMCELGLAPDKPFCVVHYRDGSYPLKGGNPHRNGLPEAYYQAIEHIIDDLGCQVVQLGHPEMTPFPARPGFIDLSRSGNSFMLQAFAVSHAKFMLASASGPATLGWSFDVPTAIVDCLEAHTGWGNAETVFLTQEVTTPTGDMLRNTSLSEAGLLDIRALARTMREHKGYSVRPNSGEELITVADHLHACSKDVSGWRPLSVAPQNPRPNSIVWPPRVRWDVKFLDV